MKIQFIYPKRSGRNQVPGIALLKNGNLSLNKNFFANFQDNPFSRYLENKRRLTIQKECYENFYINIIVCVIFNKLWNSHKNNHTE